MDIDSAREELEELVDSYERRKEEYRQDDYNESEVRNDFIDPFFQILGWDVDNTAGKPRHLREVKREASVEDDESVKKPDYEFRDDEGERKFFVEAKKPAVSLSNSEPALQTRRYGWNADLPVSILTNFEKLILYDCTQMPEEGDRVQVSRVRTFEFREYPDHLEEIAELISREAVQSGRFDEEFSAPAEQRETQTFDDVFLEQLEEWREELAENIIENNPDITEEELNYFVHRLLNRIIFLRISEDREHEPYEQLKELDDVTYSALYDIFQEADEKYNSKLFELISDYSAENLDIDADVLGEVLEQLYYPQSPYTFAVVESHIIGKIYDLFLGKSLTIENGDLEVRQKPAVEFSQGVVTTPKFVVDEIVQETITKRIEGSNPEEINDLSVADICCGSGLFLTEAYEKLLEYYTEWYVENNPDSHDSVYELGGEWRLTLEARREVLENHIFGVDIDPLAVEVARFSLLLKILEDQPNAAIEHYITNHGTPILPDLGENIKNGNSLVDETFHDQIMGDPNQEEIIQEVYPFDYDSQFPSVFQDGGFSVIIGNPPYVRIQNMVEYLPDEEMDFYTDEYSGDGYSTAQADNYDRYSIFIERALDLLKSSGSLGYIVPQKFLTVKSGENLRSLLSDGKHLRKLVHFGVEQVFEKRSNYTCLAFFESQPQETFIVEKVSSLQDWVDSGDAETITGDSDDLSSDSWTFVGDAIDDLFERITEAHEYNLGDVANIFVGAQTSCNLLYEIKYDYEEVGEFVEFEGPDGEDRKIEKSILRPYFHTTNKYKPTITPLSHIEPNGYIIYPYDENGDIIPEDTLEDEYPCAWKYFTDYRDVKVCGNRQNTLEERDLDDHSSEFYRYGRNQSLGKFVGEKIVVQVLSKEPRYGFDDTDVVVTGGGNGPFYNIRPYENIQQKLGASEDYVSSLDIRYIMAVLSHPVIEAMVRSGSSFFRGGYYSHGKRYIKDIPIKMIERENEEEFEMYQSIISFVDQYMGAHDDYEAASTERDEQIHGQRMDVLQQKIENQVSELYGFSAEEVEISQTV